MSHAFVPELLLYGYSVQTDVTDFSATATVTTNDHLPLALGVS